MEESGSHQPTIGPHQGNDNSHQVESGGSQHSQSEVNPQQRGDREKSGQTLHTNRSQSRGKSVHLLMDRIDKYRRIEEDQLQGKGKTKVIPQERRDSRSDRLQNNRPRRDFSG